MKAALFLVALIAVCSATSLFTQFPMDFSKRRSILAVMTQVESQLKTGGPLDAITKALDDFKQAIETEQQTHDRLKEKQDKECDDEFKLREAAVLEATAALKEATETLDGCKAQKIRADGDLAITKKQLSDNQQFLINAITTRNKEHYDFETLAGKHEKIIQAIDGAISYIQDFANAENRGASFAQLTKHANEMIVMAVQLRTIHHFGASLSALAQLGNMEEADDAFIEELKNIFRSFKQRSITEFQEKSDREDAAQKAFEEEKARLENTIEHLKTQKVNLEQEIADLNKCIVVQQGIVADATSKKNRNAKLLEDAQAVCAAFQREYVQATAARKEELQLLAAIRVKVEERFKQLEGKDSVQTRGKQDTFDAHVNVAAPDGAKFGRQGEVVL